MTSDDIVVKTIGKWTVIVSPYSGDFTAKKGEGESKQELSADTLPKLEELIKRQDANDRHFVPIDVISVGEDKVGRITSRVADNDSEVYFTWKEKPDAKATRRSARLDPYHFEHEQKAQFVKATPENLAIMAKIKDLSAQTAAIYRQQKALRLSYSDPITWEVIEAQDGGD